MNVAYRAELESDDLADVLIRIWRTYPAHELQARDQETLHFGYWDEEQEISPQFLSDIQDAGFRVVHASVRTAPASGRRCGYIELRKHDPREAGR